MLDAPYITRFPDLITQSHLRSILRYDHEAGVFTWLKPPRNQGRMKGKVAGSVATGYVLIKIDGRKYKAHRLAWLYVHGAFPASVIDHRDGNPLNNAMSNLRAATHAQNCANARRWAKKSLPKGVRKNGSGFTARISVQGRLITIGTFANAAEAASAYAREATRIYGEFARCD